MRRKRKEMLKKMLQNNQKNNFRSRKLKNKNSPKSSTMPTPLMSTVKKKFMISFPLKAQCSTKTESSWKLMKEKIN